MKKIHFSKYQGTGNDFILLDNREHAYDFLSITDIAKLCERRFGIGADGLMMLNNHEQYHFEMRYYNSDGRPASMCGNGGRCIAAFACDLGIIKDKGTFLAFDGTHDVEIISQLRRQKLIKLSMSDVLKVDKHKHYYYLHTGSPHYVTFVGDLEKVNVVEAGRKIRFSKAFPEGTNVNFVELTNNDLFVRTYERGVEDETFSCGTGAVASAIAFVLETRTDQLPIHVHTRGGDLEVFFHKTGKQEFTSIFLQGLVSKVYEGILEL